MALRAQKLTSGFYEVTETYDDVTLEMQRVDGVNLTDKPLWYEVSYLGVPFSDTLAPQGQPGASVGRNVSGLHIVGVWKNGTPASNWVVFPIDTFKTRWPA